MEQEMVGRLGVRATQPHDERGTYLKYSVNLL